MQNNYIKIAFRTLRKRRLTTLVNLSGLALGIAIFIMVITYVMHEFSYDQWIPNVENTFRVYRSWGGGNDGIAWSPSHLAGKLQEDFPEISYATGLSPQQDVLLDHEQKKIYVKNVAQVDSTFFRTIQIPLVEGDPHTALSSPRSIVISENLARIVFGDKNPMGETVQINGEDNFQVTGVFDMEDYNSHFNYDAYVPFTWYTDSWTANNRATFVSVQPGADIESLETKITGVITDLILKEYESIKYEPQPEELADWRLQPYQDIYLHSANIGWISGKESDIRYVRIFLMVAVLMLVIALINYINLATAQSSVRAKEVGVRKVSGAGKKELITQFLTESILQAVIAGLAASLIAEVILPLFEKLVDRDLTSLFVQHWLWASFGIIAFSVLIGIMAGSYPAFILSRFKPSRVFRSQKVVTSEKGLARKVLVSVQFSITLLLLISMAFINRQVNYMLSYDLGFSADQVLSVTLNSRSSATKIAGLRQQFLSIPGIESISVASRLPGGFIPDWGMNQQGREEMLNPNVIFTDPSFVETMDISMVAGRFLSHDFSADTINNFIVNETFVRQYNIDDPIGTKVKFSGDDQYGEIIGVCSDFYFAGVDRSIRPLVIGGQGNKWFLGIRMKTENLETTLASVGEIWQSIEPDFPIRYSFIDSAFQSKYDEYKRLGRMMLIGTILTLFIALLGLFGLTDFLVRKKVKEIGIRKVLGATTLGIMLLFIHEFLMILFISFIISTPIAVLATRGWLQNFANQISIDVFTIVIAFVLIVFVTSVIVALRSLFAAQANPVESLRSE